MSKDDDVKSALGFTTVKGISPLATEDIAKSNTTNFILMVNSSLPLPGTEWSALL